MRKVYGIDKYPDFNHLVDDWYLFIGDPRYHPPGEDRCLMHYHGFEEDNGEKPWRDLKVYHLDLGTLRCCKCRELVPIEIFRGTFDGEL